MTSKDGNPKRLRCNAEIAFQGTVVHGRGFVLKKEEAKSLIGKDQRNADVLVPYLRGEDFNSNPNQSPSTYVINFRDWPLAKAQSYPDCLDILRKRVKPERDKLVAKGGQIHEYDYWKFWDKRLESYERIIKLDKVLFHSFTSKFLAFSFVPPTYVFAAPHVVIGFNDYGHFAVLQSNIHEAWVRHYTSYSLSLARYTPTDCFETFPFPEDCSIINAIGELYFKYRKELMINSKRGLIDIYNQFHNPKESCADISKMRGLHIEMDVMVAKAYGWHDLSFSHDFVKTARDGIRFTIAQKARNDLLIRLLRRNHELHQNENSCT